MVSMGLAAKLSDKIMLAHSRKLNVESGADGRLILMGFGGPLIPIGLFWYGWAADARTHWIVPMLGTVVLGAGMMITAVSLVHILSYQQALILSVIWKPLHDRCLRPVCSFSTCWVVFPESHCRGATSPCRTAPVQRFGRRLGGIRSCFYLAGDVHYTPGFVALWQGIECKVPYSPLGKDPSRIDREAKVDGSTKLVHSVRYLHVHSCNLRITLCG